MKAILLIAALFITTMLYAQTSTDIVIAHNDSIYSKTLKEKRKFWVSMPEKNEDDAYGSQRYPVIYVFDADLQVAGMVRQMEGGSGNLNFPKTIVVGIITNANRTRDLTPSHSNGAPLQDSISSLSSGGGENFTVFLEKELIPHIDSIYPTAPYRTLIGHSLGGLMTINTLIHHTKLFNNYVATEPSLWWDGQKLLKDAKLALEQRQFKNIALFVGIAHTQPAEMDSALARKSISSTTIGIRSILDLCDYAKANKNNEMSFSYKYYPEYNHQSVALPANYDALMSVFRFYSMDFPYNTFFQPTGTNDVLSDHYKKLSKQMGYTVSPPAGFVSTLAHVLTGAKQWDRALDLLTLNKNNHPDSYLVYEELGDFYVKRDNKKEAISWYETALKHKDVAQIKIKLEKIRPN